MNYYMKLGITPDATEDEVRQAYLELAKKYHPDKNKSPEANAMMAEINLAYETLCDSHRRKEYDLENGIAVAKKAVSIEQYVSERAEEMEEQEETPPIFGKCLRCSFVDCSGIFICSVCGYVFDPEGKRRKTDQYNSDTDFGYEESHENRQVSEDNLSEIIRCPQCNEINRYSSGSCWQCGLIFEIDETT